MQNVHGRQIRGTQQAFTVKGVFYLFIGIGLVVAIGLSFRLNVPAPQMQRDAPERLGNLELVGTFRSTEVRAQINRLHGLAIDLTDAFVAVYPHSSP